MAFPNNRELDSHRYTCKLASTQQSTHTCSLCILIFESRSLLLQHMQTDHIDSHECSNAAVEAAVIEQRIDNTTFDNESIDNNSTNDDSIVSSKTSSTSAAYPADGSVR